MKRVRTRLGALTATVALSATVLAAFGGTAHALSSPTHPALSVDRLIPSNPWPNGPGGNGITTNDVEGIASVPDDHSLWVADDNRARIYEIDSSSGALKAQVTQASFLAAPQVGTGTLPDVTRADDIESIVYDTDHDVMYVTSGNCCGIAPFNPTIYKLTRDGSNHFTPTSWQALPEGEDPTAAGWRPGVGMYYGHGSKIKTYDYATNTVGPTTTLSVTSIEGLTFVDDNTVFITTSSTKDADSSKSDSTIRRFSISGSTWSAVSGWTFPLAGTGMRDARDLAIIGDFFYVTDGFDGSSGPQHPVFVYKLGEATRGGYILDGYGGLHGYATGGSPAALATSGSPYWNGQDIARGIAVLPDNSGGYVLDGFGGLHPFGIGGHAAPPAAVGGPYWNGWNIARGVALTANGKGGYVIDGYGGLHAFKVGNSGTAPATPSGGPYWNGWDIARGIAIVGNGGYVLDGFGALQGFKIGSGGTKPAATVGGPYWNGWNIARGVTIVDNGGYVVDGFGGTHAFKIGSGGTTPLPTTGGPYWNGWDITRGIASTN